MTHPSEFSSADMLAAVYAALPARTGQIVAALGVSLSSVSRALRLLRAQGCIRRGECGADIPHRSWVPWLPVRPPTLDLVTPLGIDRERASRNMARAAADLRELELRRGTCRVLVANGVAVEPTAKAA